MDGARHPARRALRWPAALRITHPFPTIANAVVAGGLGMIAMGRLQLSPPIVRLALVLLAATAILSAGFGLAAWLLALAALSCGLVYDLKLSRTPWSVLPYLIALPLVPIWIWVALGRFRPLLLAALPLGALLGLSLHLANGLTYFESDARTGSGGLVQRLGFHRARGLCWGAFGLVWLLLAASLPLVPYRPAPLLIGLILAMALLIAAVAMTLLHVRAAAQAGWGLLLAGSAALALGWLAALPVR